MRLTDGPRNNWGMPENAHYRLFFVAGIIIYTAVTCWTDLRARKIYNWTTLPMWILGWVYQATFFRSEGIFNGIAGFAIGFGMFFVLWRLSLAGGGDVKLMGALGVWLGGPLTLKVIIASLIFVAGGVAILLVIQAFRRSQVLRPQPADINPQILPETSRRKSARLMAFAPPVALGTWSVLLLFQGQW